MVESEEVIIVKKEGRTEAYQQARAEADPNWISPVGAQEVGR